MTDNLGHLKIVLEQLRKKTLFTKFNKFNFGGSRVDYLGVCRDRVRGVHIPKQDSDNQGVAAAAESQAIVRLLRFYGVLLEVHKGIRDAKQTTNQVAQKNVFLWGMRASKAFEELKTVMTTTLVLALPDMIEMFTVETNASNIGIGAILMQRVIRWHL